MSGFLEMKADQALQWASSVKDEFVESAAIRACTRDSTGLASR